MAYNKKRSNARLSQRPRYSCARTNSKAGRRVGLFIGGMMFGLVRGIFFKNKY